MGPHLSRMIRLLVVAGLLIGIASSGRAPGQIKKSLRSRVKQAIQKGSSAWTVEEAMAQLQLYPHDPYLQYVVMTLADREGAKQQVAEQIDQLVNRDIRQERAREVDLFSIFTGALAVQESLQLSALRGPQGNMPGAPVQRPIAVPAPERPTTGEDKEPAPLNAPIKIASLAGPTVRSHPWQEMLGGKKPEISPLAFCVPDDFYFIDFRSLRRLLEAMEISDLWGTHLFNQTAQEARTQQVGERIRAQLAVETNPLLRPFYDLVVERVGVTGSDFFVREGSDVTLLFRFTQPELFKARMDGFLASVEKNHKDAKRSTGTYLGIDYVHVAVPDRTIHVFSAYPEAGLHVRSNSLVALKRVLEAIRGKKAGVDGRAVRRLGDTAEFAYIRTLMPEGAKEETGLVYLSDPFIRRLVGPELKLTESRRMLCYTYLRMIGHAAMLYQSEHGRKAQSLEELVEARCLPSEVTWGHLAACPDGGKHSLGADGVSGVCSHHGRAHFLRPCCEIPVREVTKGEADQYKSFLAEYNQYWRMFFDPIALRLQITPERYRLETIVLPLIDNSIYTGLASVLAGKPEPLDALPVPPRNIFSVAVRVNKGNAEEKTVKPPPQDWRNALRYFLGYGGREIEDLGVEEFLLRGLGSQLSLHVCDAEPLFDFNLPAALGQAVGSFQGRGPGLGMNELPFIFLAASFQAPVYIAAPVADAKIVDVFLERLDRFLPHATRQRQNWGGFFTLQYDFYQIPLTAKTSCRSVAVQFGPMKWRLFWARIGDGFYIATKKSILEEIQMLSGKPQSKTAESGLAAHAFLRIRAEHWDRVLNEFRLGWAENSRTACLNNVGPLSSVARSARAKGGTETGGAPKIAEITRLAEQMYDVHFFCPDGGRYELAGNGKSVLCSIHGTALSPRQPRYWSEKGPQGKAMGSFGGLTAMLTFLEDGLHAVVTIDRK
jgi:hypothetical protein